MEHGRVERVLAEDVLAHLRCSIRIAFAGVDNIEASSRVSQSMAIVRARSGGTHLFGAPVAADETAVLWLWMIGKQPESGLHPIKMAHHQLGLPGHRSPLLVDVLL
jgi:hypothetical protein